nr:eukaryotic translation initiation factor 3 subunit A-like [Tanacetum cinerariifolium]
MECMIVQGNLKKGCDRVIRQHRMYDPPNHNLVAELMKGLYTLTWKNVASGLSWLTVALEDALDVDDLEADKRPEEMRLSYTYNTVLEILRNNSKLMALYAIVQYPLEHPEKFEKFSMTPSREYIFYDPQCDCFFKNLTLLLRRAESWSSYGWRKDYDCGLEAWLATLISHVIIEKVKEIIPVICAFYDMYLDADAGTLAWLFAMDGMFLLDQLDAYSDHDFAIRSKRFDHVREPDSTFHVGRNPKGTIRRKCSGQSLGFQVYFLYRYFFTLGIEVLEPPPLLKELIMKKHPKSASFIDNIRRYNSMFSTTSMGGK